MLKIEHLLDAARTRSDYPFCRDEVNYSVQMLAGVPLSRMYNELLVNTVADDQDLGKDIAARIASSLRSKPAGEQDDAIRAFVAELTSLLTIYKPVLQSIAAMESVLNPNLLAKVNFLGTADGVVLRIIANDGHHMDVLAPRESLEGLGESLLRAHVELSGEEHA